jgi:hypothetical protein
LSRDSGVNTSSNDTSSRCDNLQVKNMNHLHPESGRHNVQTLPSLLLLLLRLARLLRRAPTPAATIPAADVAIDKQRTCISYRQIQRPNTITTPPATLPAGSPPQSSTNGSSICAQDPTGRLQQSTTQHPDPHQRQQDVRGRRRLAFRWPSKGRRRWKRLADQTPEKALGIDEHLWRTLSGLGRTHQRQREGRGGCTEGYREAPEVKNTTSQAKPTPTPARRLPKGGV